MDKAEIVKMINDINKRINEVEYKLEKYLLNKHQENEGSITDTDMAVMELANIIESLSSNSEIDSIEEESNND